MRTDFGKSRITYTTHMFPNKARVTHKAVHPGWKIYNQYWHRESKASSKRPYVQMP